MFSAITKDRKLALAKIAAAGLMIFLAGHALDITAPFMSNVTENEHIKSTILFLLLKCGSLMWVLGFAIIFAAAAALFLPQIIETFVSILYNDKKTISELVETLHCDIVSRIPNHKDISERYVRQKDCEGSRDCITKDLDRRIASVAAGVGDIATRYGHHSTKPESYYSFMHNAYLYPYCRIPHRSQQTLDIRIKPIPDCSEYLEWNETNLFKIHDPMFYAGTNATFPIKIGFQSVLKDDQDIEAWAKTLKFGLKIEGEKIDLGKYCIIDDASQATEDSILYIYRRGPSMVSVKYKMEYKVLSEYTSIETTEISHIDVNDTVFSYTAHMPICKMKVQFDIPNGWTFLDSFESYYDDVHKYMPESYKKQISKESIVAGRLETPQKFEIIMNDWVPPGIAFSVRWRKESHEELSGQCAMK
jgi:transcription elongation factor Elf1